MQVVSPLSPETRFVGKESFAELYGKLNDDFSSKLKVGFTNEEEEEEEKNRDDNDFEKTRWNQNDDDEEREEGEDEEFSFTSVNSDNTTITADEAFEDGQIRPVYPLFNRNLIFEPDERSLHSPLKKLFVENEEESEPVGPYCSWSGKTVVEKASPETCRKSNSTGFSKLWRFRDLVSRSSSDGKDAFVFLNHGDKKKNQSSSKSSGVVKRTEKGKEKKKKKMMTGSAHERLYMRNRAIREEEKRRSYLPYKHVGFFTNVNGLTRNVHPY